MSNTKQILRIPLHVKASSPEELSKKCLENNLRYQLEFHYFHIHKEGSTWFAWYYVDTGRVPVFKERNS